MNIEQIERMINQRVDAKIAGLRLEVDDWNFGAGWTINLMSGDDVIDSVEIDNSYTNQRIG